MDTVTMMLRAVIADPEDDTARLVAADAFEERNDEDRYDRERAEYIRLAVGLEGGSLRCPYAGPAWMSLRPWKNCNDSTCTACPGRIRMADLSSNTSMKATWTNHAFRWLEVEWYRGFVGGVNLIAAQLTSSRLDQVAALGYTHPILYVGTNCVPAPDSHVRPSRWSWLVGTDDLRARRDAGTLPWNLRRFLDPAAGEPSVQRQVRGVVHDFQVFSYPNAMSGIGDLNRAILSYIRRQRGEYYAEDET